MGERGFKTPLAPTYPGSLRAHLLVEDIVEEGRLATAQVAGDDRH